MYLQLPSARWEARQGHTRSLACSALARCWPCARDTDLGEGEGQSEEPQEEGMLALQARVQGKEAEGAHSAGHSAVPMITLSSSRRVYEGFGNYYNHLLCRVQTDPVSLCFRALKAEARRSRFQHKRLHNSWGRREETSLLAKADQLFLNNSTCVLALGKRGRKGGNITV